MITPLFIMTSKNLMLSDLMSLLSISSIYKYAYSNKIPSNYRRILRDYLISLPGFDENISSSIEIYEDAKSYHNQTSMLIAQMITDNTSYFNRIEYNEKSTLKFLDASELQSLNRLWLKNNEDLGNLIIKNIKLLPERSMVLITISKEPIDINLIKNIKDLAENKEIVIVWLCTESVPNEVIKVFNCNYLHVNKNKKIADFKLTLKSNKSHHWKRKIQ